MTTTSKGPWGLDEIDAGISLYLLMLACAANRRPYNKAAMIRHVQNNHAGPIDSGLNTAPLKERSRGSIEAKLMNVTAAVESLGRPDLSMSEHGYRPFPNMQKALKERVAERIDGVYIAVDVNRDVEFEADCRSLERC